MHLALEEVIIHDNVEKALEKVIKKHKCKIVDYTVAPRFMQSGKKRLIRIMKLGLLSFHLKIIKL